jgi:hypothetical protein
VRSNRANASRVRNSNRGKELNEKPQCIAQVLALLSWLYGGTHGAESEEERRWGAESEELAVGSLVGAVIWTETAGQIGL